MAKAMLGAVSLAYGLLLLVLGPRGAVGLGDGGEAWGEGWEEMGRQERVEEGEVDIQMSNRQGRRLGEAEGIAAYNRVDTPFAGELFHKNILTLKKSKIFSPCLTQLFSRTCKIALFF